MDFNNELTKISDDYNELIEELIPRSVPPASRLMKKRENRESFFLKAGRLGIAYVFLIAVFASISLLMINSLGSDKSPKKSQLVNVEIFSTDHPGSLVTAFRQVIE